MSKLQSQQTNTPPASEPRYSAHYISNFIADDVNLVMSGTGAAPYRSDELTRAGWNELYKIAANMTGGPDFPGQNGNLPICEQLKELLKEAFKTLVEEHGSNPAFWFALPDK